MEKHYQHRLEAVGTNSPSAAALLQEMRLAAPECSSNAHEMGPLGTRRVPHACSPANHNAENARHSSIANGE